MTRQPWQRLDRRPYNQRSAPGTAVSGPPPRENVTTGRLAGPPLAPCAAVILGTAGGFAVRRWPKTGRICMVFYGRFQPAAADFNGADSNRQKGQILQK